MIHPGAGYHMNKEYPTKVTLEPPAEISPWVGGQPPVRLEQVAPALHPADVDAARRIRRFEHAREAETLWRQHLEASLQYFRGSPTGPKTVVDILA